LEYLWSPWRLEYVTGDKPSAGECIFCWRGRAEDLSAGASAKGDSPDPLVLFRGPTCYIVLNKYPYNNGHLLLVPYSHVPSLAGLRVDELNELATLTQRSELALREAYNPDAMNIGINLGKPAGAGIVEHVHIHVVPRWNGDTNFMTVFGETRVLPEDLAGTAARLRPIFKRLAS
jgi:ATP adenylyltransferase